MVPFDAAGSRPHGSFGWTQPHLSGRGPPRTPAEAIGVSGASPIGPIEYEEIRESYLPEYEFHGKSQHHKSHYALTAAAIMRAGIDPDLFGEA